MTDLRFVEEEGAGPTPSRPFILWPVAAWVLMTAITLSGTIAFEFLPLAALPEVDSPTMEVQTFYSGASPEVMTVFDRLLARFTRRAPVGAGEATT